MPSFVNSASPKHLTKTRKYESTKARGKETVMEAVGTTQGPFLFHFVFSSFRVFVISLR
jgi:hypothetical protein